jgi:hypothetical protein
MEHKIKDIRSNRDQLAISLKNLEKLYNEKCEYYDRELHDLKNKERVQNDNLEYLRKEIDEKQNNIEELLNPVLKDLHLQQLAISVNSLNSVIKGIEKQSVWLFFSFLN